MELFWYFVLVTMLAIYVILDGYDFGAGIVYLFFAKNEDDKKSITKAIGPFWDANEVWLIAAGGVLFFAFPTLYASSFSGFYLPLIMILWLLIFRAIGLELRGQIHNRMWEAVWDKAFGISSLLMALFLGIAMGNVLRGVNLGGVVDGVSTYESHYFFLPLWNPTFSPVAESQGIIDWFTILLGLIAVVSLTIHGANWIILKTNSSINNKLKNVIFTLTIALMVLSLIAVLVWHIVDPDPFRNFIKTPWLWVLPIMTIASLVGLLRIKSFKKDGTGFLFSSMFLLSGFAASAASIFPNVLPSTNDVNPSLTLYNVAADEYGLSVGLSWFFIAVVLVIIYLIVQYRVFKGKLDHISYGDH